MTEVEQVGVEPAVGLEDGGLLAGGKTNLADLGGLVGFPTAGLLSTDCSERVSRTSR